MDNVPNYRVIARAVGPWQSPGTVLYTGVTRDLVRRVYEHKNHVDKDSFTAKYNVTKLVYFEQTTDVRSAIEREKQIRSWSRDRKTSLVFEMNPKWVHLYNQILG